MKTISAHSKSTVLIIRTNGKIFISWHYPFYKPSWIHWDRTCPYWSALFQFNYSIWWQKDICVKMTGLSLISEFSDITVLLSLTVFHNIVQETLPQVSDSVPVIGISPAPPSPYFTFPSYISVFFCRYTVWGVFIICICMNCAYAVLVLKYSYTISVQCVHCTIYMLFLNLYL